MKKALLILGLVLCFAAAGSAQVSTPFSFYAGGALSLPSAPEAFSDAWKTGYHGSLGVGYKWMPNFQIVGKLEYHNFGTDASMFDDLEGGNTKVWMYGADARYSLGVPASPLKPFFFGGLGMASMSWTELEGTSLIASTFNSAFSETFNELYYNVGAGVELKSGPSWSFFGQVRYVSIATEGESTSFIPVTLGVKFF